MTVKIVEILTGFFEATFFYMILDAFLPKKEDISKWYYIIGLLLFGIIVDISFYFYFGTLQNTLIMYFCAFLFSLLFNGGLKNKILVPIIGITLNGCCEILVLYSLGLIFGTTTTELISNKLLWIVGALSSKFIFLLVTYFIRVRYKQNKLFSKTSYWGFLVVVFAPAISTAFVLFRLMYDVSDSFVFNVALFTCIGLIASAFASMYLYEHISKQSELLNREEQYKQQIRSQTKHLDDILVMQNQIKGFRHDIKNHWVVLRGYFQRNDYEGGIQYIDEISDKLISGETIDTGNVALDAIISTKKALAEEKNIEFESTVQIPEKMPIDATDICIIFGNSLDNAIEACEKIKDDRKHIKLSVIFEEDAILCKVSNSISKGKKLSMKTTKTDKENHGFGLENIKQALSKYNHVLKIDQTDDEFILSFIIFNK